MKKKKRLKLKLLPIFIVVTLGVGLGIGLSLLVNDANYRTGYIKGNENAISSYNDALETVEKFARGSEISYTTKDAIEQNGTTYYKAKIGKNNYYLNKENITDTKEDIVAEKEVYVRTTYHLLGEALDGTLLSLLEKGSKLSVEGYHNINGDGSVDYYKTTIDGITGYFPAKYTLQEETEANKNYDEENTYQVHVGRKDIYGGGNAASADYYPVEKPTFTENPMPEEVRAFYLNGTKSVMSKVDQYIELAKKANINAFVVDIKDSGVPAYQSKVYEQVSPTNYQYAQQTMEEYRAQIQKIKDAGFYVIGRISAFKDKYYAMDHPEHAILDTSTNEPYLLSESYWPSAFSRDVWKYNVDLAKEAVQEMGFNEIQFDYVRFPDRTIKIEREGKLNLQNEYNEEKIQAIQRFLMYACNELHTLGVYVSADVFGESAHSYVTAYGQYWGAISNVVDVISAMPYPDHFSTYEYGFKVPVWTVPYDILYYWGKNYAAVRQSEIPTPAIARTWIQTYNTIKKPYITYGAKEVSDQIQGLYDAGLTGGFMTWNSSSNLEKLESQLEAYQKEYIK